MKQVIVVNNALQLPAGKMAAQVAHASIAAFLEAVPEDQEDWIRTGMPKIVVGAPSEEALKELMVQAQATGIVAYLVRDAGKTLLPSGTITCLGIGPSEIARIDALTKHLELI